MNNRTYVCIDLKSFYASVECVARGLDPFKTNLVVADPDRTEKTICLAVSPAMKALGVPGRCRVFEIPKSIKYIMAVPRMQKYIDVSADIYGIYLSYISKDDIHVYSIDEVFMDVTDYLDMYGCDARKLSLRMMNDIYKKTGITASCGIGTNLYLAKIAMDIMAKHSADHIAFLDEDLYQKRLWDHLPLTDFWRVGPGTVRRLSRSGIETMRDIAHADEDLLYHLFGIDAELLIDHAWGRETATIKDIKKYKPSTNGISNGQVLSRDYGHEEGLLIVKEMADLLTLELVKKNKVTESVSLYLSYGEKMGYEHGSARLASYTNSSSVIVAEVAKLYQRIKDPSIPIRRVNLSFNNIVEDEFRQMSLFNDIDEEIKEVKMQKAVISLKEKYGSNAVLKGMNLEEGGKTIERNNQIGGHRR
ncbi:MAG: DNA repair protein [Lachnospiraceae bacterium]|nr:DNA repair protein [Lachnospiraceae bacterium]